MNKPNFATSKDREYFEALNSEIDNWALEASKMPDNDGDQVTDYLLRMGAILPRTGELVAETQRLYESRRGLAAERFTKLEDKVPWGAMSAMIEGDCHLESFLKVKAERLNRAITHNMDAMRSVLSKIKSEMEMSKYNGA